MLNEKEKVVITNRYPGKVSYFVPDMNITRTFGKNETKRIATVEEIRALDATSGGHELLAHYLLIEKPQALVQELFGEVEPEYNYTQKDVVQIMKNGTLDEFKDCMDFAPQGIIDMVKTLAVTMPLNDAAKRDYIYEKTGLDVTSAIENAKVSEVKDAVAADKPQRRVAASTGDKEA